MFAPLPKINENDRGLFEGFRSEKWFELQIFWNVNIHIFDQSCTWEDLANFKKCQRLFQLLWGQGTHYFHPNALEILSSVEAGECFLEVAEGRGLNSTTRMDEWMSICHDFYLGK